MIYLNDFLKINNETNKQEQNIRLKIKKKFSWTVCIESVSNKHND